MDFIFPFVKTYDKYAFHQVFFFGRDQLCFYIRKASKKYMSSVGFHLTR